MNERRKVLLFSVLIMACIALAVGAVALVGLYRAAFEQQRERLVETVQSRARLIEAVARFDVEYSAADVPGGPEAATLTQVVRASSNSAGLGKPGSSRSHGAKATRSSSCFATGIPTSTARGPYPSMPSWRNRCAGRCPENQER